jgi:hypothetical protein
VREEAVADAFAQHATEHERAHQVRRAVTETERSHLGGVALEGEPAHHHDRGADQRARAGDDRGRAAVTERVHGTREEEERAVGEQTDAERGERSREQIGVVTAVADREHAHHRQRERDVRRAHRQQQPRHAVESPPQSTGERLHVTATDVGGELREDRRVDRLRQDRVGREERHEAELVGHHSPGDLIAHHERGAEQDGDVGLERDPRRQPQQPAQLAVDRAEAGTEAEPRAQQRDRRHPDEADHAERAADREHELLGHREVEARVGPVQRVEDRHRGDEDDGVGDGSHRHDHEAALGEEDRGGHGADRVEQDLRDEEAQEEGRERHLLGLDVGVRGAARQEPGDGRGEDDADDRDDRHDGQGQAQHARGQPLGLGVVVVPEQVDEGGHQHGREGAGGDELEEDVRDRARGLVGVAEVGGTQDGGDHPDLDEPHPAGGERGDAHPRRCPRRSFAGHHQRASLRGRARFAVASGHAGAGRPPRRRRPCWGDGPLRRRVGALASAPTECLRPRGSPLV